MVKRAVMLTLLLWTNPAPASAERRISEETILFRQLRSAVVTVTGDEGSGSGFIVDSSGIILTNDHVVGGAERIRVKLNDSTRVVARFLASDPKRDIAAIQVSPKLVAALHVLRLATQSDTMVFEGEKVIAIGSPLNQEKIMTAGIVSKVEPTAIISDVNINHGNSGGPLINMNGEVIGVNTFLDPATASGPGISGSVLITQAAEVLTRARAAARDGTTPSAALLPIASRTPFPLDTLQQVIELKRIDAGAYDVSKQVDTGRFEVVVVTPIYDAWRSHEYDIKRAEHVKKREKKGGGATTSGSDPTRQMREWMRYTGNDYTPVVTLQFTPEYGETGGSVLGNLLGAMAAGMAGSGYRGSHKYEFKADFKDVWILRNGVEVPDIMRGKCFIPLEFARSTWSADYWGEDFARVGIFQCGPEWFAPDSAGFPVLEVGVTSVERPDKAYRFFLPEKTVRRVWADFAAHRAITAPSPFQGVPVAAVAEAPMDSAVAASATELSTSVTSNTTTDSTSAPPRPSPSDAGPRLSGAPLTICLKNGDLVAASSIEPHGLDSYKVTATSGESKYYSINKIRVVVGADGTDWTKDVLENRRRAP